LSNGGMMNIEKFSNAMGVSGDEWEIRRLLTEEAEKYADSVEIDAMGNIIALKRGTGGKKKLMAVAHMDEVGFLVTGIDESGFLKLGRVGGIDPRVCVDKRVIVGRDKIPGVIMVKPIHLTSRDERGKPVPFSSLLVDIGTEKKEETAKYVKLGDPVAFDTKFEKLSNSMIKGKAFDDRLGCVAIIELLKKRYKHDFYAVFTVQEEVVLRGASVIGERIKADYAIILEGTGAQDFPHKKDINKSPKIGAGPCVTIKDGRSFASKELLKLTVKVAEENKIPFQFKKPGVGGTDAGVLQISGTGIKTIVYATPARYIHSPVSISSVNDLKNKINLTDLVLKSL